MLPNNAEANLVLEDVKPLSKLIYSILERSIHQALDWFSRQDVDAACFLYLVRYCMKEALKKHGSDSTNKDAKWQIDGFEVNVADSGGWRSAFRTDVDHDSEVMAISIPN
jgi:hypothetical protein